MNTAVKTQTEQQSRTVKKNKNQY